MPDNLAGQRLDQALARMFPEYSRSRLQSWLVEGHILLDARAAKSKQKIWGGERVLLTKQPGPGDANHAAEAIELSVAFEDEFVLVVDKPAGLVVHPGSGNWRGTMLNALLHRVPLLGAIPRAGIVHRLDKNTSGLMVVAKTLESQIDLVRQIQARTVRREYLALVHGRVASAGAVDAPIGRDPRTRTRMAVTGRGKPALTRYRVLRQYRDATLLECALSTGRTHQIRVHLHSLGYAIVGDPVYRAPAARNSTALLTAFPRQALHALRLEFRHPASGETVRFESPVPADIAALIASLP